MVIDLPEKIMRQALGILIMLFLGAIITGGVFAVRSEAAELTAGILRAESQLFSADTRSHAGRSQATGSQSQVLKRSGFTVFKAARSWSFNLQAANGYTVIVYVIGRKTAFLDVISRDASVEYIARASVRGGEVRARFGRLGRLSMRFEPREARHSTTEPQGDCRGRPALVQKGVFRGLFRWRGEQAFSSARTEQVRGLSVRSFREVCKGTNAGVGNDAPIQPMLIAKSRGGGRSVEVQTYSYPDGGQPSFAASLAESRGRLRISRSLFQDGQPTDLTIDRDGAITIAPPFPFGGSAKFEPVQGNMGSWNGGLTGDFPGLGRVSLAGPSFSAVRFEAG